MTWLDAAAVLGIAVCIAVLASALHPATRPIALRVGRALWWLGFVLLAALAWLVLGRRRDRERAEVPPPAPEPPTPVDGYLRRVRAEQVQREREAEVEAAGDDLDELARLEREARARAGLPPA